MLDRLWRVAFGPRPAWYKPLQLVIWALFGNAEDGPYGFYAPRPDDIATATPDWRATWKWWSRNPIHNLTHHVISVPFSRQVVLFGTPSGSPGLWPIGKVLVAINGLPIMSIQTDRIEAYAGFRPRTVNGTLVGVFGLALRRRS